MKSLSQFINENMILELSSALLTRASQAAREKGRNSQANKFAIAAGKALERELKGWKPGPDAKNCGKVVAAIKDLSQSNSAVKALVKEDPAKEMSEIKFPVLKDDGEKYIFQKWRKVKVPKAKFYIYKDEYHRCLHISTISDIIGMIGAAYWDFEDFDASYIVKTFDNLKDAVEYAQKSGEKFYDSEEFMNSVKDGDITDDDFYWDGPGESIIDYMLEWADVENLPNE